MKMLLIGNVRKDGKQKVRLSYKGAPNMFGGFYADKVYTKLLPVAQVEELAARIANDELSEV